MTAAVQVTRNPDPARAHATPVLARNPKTGELVIAETEYRTTLACNVHISTDDGRSWAPGGDFMLNPYTNCGGDALSTINITMAFDANGVLFLSYAAHDPKWDTMGIAASTGPATSSLPVPRTVVAPGRTPWCTRRPRARPAIRPRRTAGPWWPSTRRALSGSTWSGSSRAAPGSRRSHWCWRR